MKKLIATFSLALLSCTALQAAPTDRYDSRVDVSRIASDESRTYRGDRDEDNRGGWAAAEIARLNRDVREVRMQIGESSLVGKRIRDRFHRVLDATESLNARFRRGSIRGREVHDRAEAIRADLDSIRRELRERRGEHHNWR